LAETMTVEFTKSPQKPILKYVLIQELELHTLTKWLANLFSSLMTFCFGVFASNAFVTNPNSSLVMFSFALGCVFCIVFVFLGWKNYDITKRWYGDDKRTIVLETGSASQKH